MGPRVLPAASPRPGGQPHPTRQRAAQGLGLGSQGCCDQVPRVSRHQTAFAHSSGGKEPQAKVSSGLVPPEALKDLALVPPERLAAPATLGPRRLARAPPPSAPAFTWPSALRPSGSASAPLLMGAPVTAVGTRRTRTRLPPRKPHCDAGRARRPWRARPWGYTLPASADAGAGVGGTGPGCLGGSPLQPRTLGALVAVTVTAAGPPLAPRSWPATRPAPAASGGATETSR